ncbi:MAG: hypothetical protein J6V08_02770 [Candidatus Methanomethylophilaceae archaeon]|nr:hypothetical protein [Candidatus Methanomethylophilaceae archaeon]
MKIRIIEQMDEYIISYDNREIRIEKPKTLKEVKKIAREHFNAIGKHVTWEIL